MAQDTLPQTGRAWTVIPSFGVTTELSRLAGDSAQPRRTGTEWITQGGPGLQIVSRSGRVRGSLDGRLIGTVHARDSELNTVTANLAMAGQADVIPGLVYVDALANIGRQSTTVYGLNQQNTSLRSGDALREVATVSISPFIRGSAGRFVDYELRHTGQGTFVRKLADGNSTNQQTSASVRSRPGPQLGWALQASTQRVDYDTGRRTQLDRVVASVSYALASDLRLSARAGQESTDVDAQAKQSYNTYGAGVLWTPSPRTTLSFDADKRYYGTGYQLVAEHRFRRAAVRFTSVRDSTSSIDGVGVGQPVTLLQLYLLQYASIEPDPALRELRVRELLRLTNQDPTALVRGGLATAAVALQRRNDLSLSLLGPRDTLTVQAFTSTSQTLDRLSPAATTGRLRQSGLVVAGTHRLTPVTNLTLSGSYYRNTDEQPLNPPGFQGSLALGLTTSLDTRTTASVGARFSRTRNSTVESTREIALSSSANVRF